MTSVTRRRLLGVPLALSTLSLAACGGGDDDDSSGGGTANVRLLNVMVDVPSADVAVDTTAWFSGVAVDTVSDYDDKPTDTVTLLLRAAGSTTTLLGSSQGFGGGLSYTLIAWGRSTAPQMWKLEENSNTSEITDGKGRVRVFGATQDVGLLDVYLTGATADLASSTPVFTGTGEGAGTGYAAVTAGTYRLRVTTSGNPDDVRLDVASVTVAATKYATLVLTAGVGGTLVNAYLLEQQGALTALRNTNARVRVAAGVANQTTVGVTWGGSTVYSTALVSPVVSPYVLVPAGTNALALSINGAGASSQNATLAAGGDYTVLVTGTAAASQMAVLSEDNRIPSTLARTRIRLVHGAASQGPLTLTVDDAVIASDVAPGTSSAVATVVSNSSARVEVTTVTSSDPLFLRTDANLQVRGVYTVFALDGPTAGATGLLRKDR
ncbi:MAG TPA: DUF4397 domain-containing protein [Burkholderiaceae bacterium]|nr:DUF4397 domain-containing protein [Burkholderiaceae bacterium]